MLVQWLHLYEISLPTLLTALNSLNQTFDKYDLYAANNGDILIVATPDPATDISIKTTWDQLPTELRSELELVGLDNMISILSRKLASKIEIDALIAANNASHNSDYFPLLSLNAPKDRFKKSNSSEIFGLSAMGISDNPYKNEYVSTSRLYSDDHHPYGHEVKLARQIENILLHNASTVDIDFASSGYLQALTQPQYFCDSKKSRDAWIQAFYNIAVLANNYGSTEFRDKILSYAGRFDCIDELERDSAALFNTLVISLSKFDSFSGEALRKNLLDLQDANLGPTYKSFIISCYLSSLISDKSGIRQEDLDTIEKIRINFDTNNLWLEALLKKKLARG